MLTAMIPRKCEAVGTRLLRRVLWAVLIVLVMAVSAPVFAALWLIGGQDTIHSCITHEENEMMVNNLPKRYL